MLVNFLLKKNIQNIFVNSEIFQKKFDFEEKLKSIWKKNYKWKKSKYFGYPIE